MKFLKCFNIVLVLASFNYIFAMQDQDTKSVPKIPVSIFQELAKAGINTKAKTEKEIFAITDKFMKANPKTGKPVSSGAAKAVMNLIKANGSKNYGDFKASIINNIIYAKAQNALKQIIKEHPDLIELDDGIWTGKNGEKKLKLLEEYKYLKNKIEIAADLRAFSWAKYQQSHDEKFKEKLQEIFIKNFNVKDVNLDLLETLLKFGANPNHYIFSDINNSWLDFITSDRILHSNMRLPEYAKRLELLELLLKYGANPNFKAPAIQIKHNFIWGDSHFPNYPLHRALIWEVENKKLSEENLKNRLEIIKLLLKYDADPSLQDNQGDTALDYANLILKDLKENESFLNYFKEDKRVTIIREIIELLEDGNSHSAKKQKKK